MTEQKADPQEGGVVADGEDNRVTLRQALASYPYLFGIAGVIVLLDQWTKGMVRNNLVFGEQWMPLDWLEPFARIVHWRNTGAAFGVFQEGSLIFTYLAVIVAAVIIYYFPQVPKEDWPLRLAMSLQMGGALGNFTDRIRFGHVTDFISVGSFPVFNIADSSITVGVVVLLIGVWILEKNEKARLEIDSGEGTPSD